MGQAFIAPLKNALEDNFTEDVQEAYVAFYVFVTTMMQEGLLNYKVEDLGECI